MKASWAYNNGKREMNGVINSLKAPKRGWIKIGKIEAGELFAYAERNKYNETKLVIKTYANKTQAVNMLNQLRTEGTKCSLRLKYPFVIEKVLIKETTN